MLMDVVALVTAILEKRQDFALEIDARLFSGLHRRNSQGKDDASVESVSRSQGCNLREGGDIAVNGNSNRVVRRPQDAGHSGSVSVWRAGSVSDRSSAQSQILHSGRLRSRIAKLRRDCHSGCASLTPPLENCLLYTSPSPRDRQTSRMPS